MKLFKELEKLNAKAKPTLKDVVKARELASQLHQYKPKCAVSRLVSNIEETWLDQNRPPLVIMLVGPMGSGKSTMAEALRKAFVNRGVSCAVRPVAKGVKDIAYAMGWDGQKDEKGRKLLQTIGTECGRDCISDSIWASKWYAACLDLNTKVIICDDCRFDNEFEAGQDLAAELGADFHAIKIVGRKAKDTRPWWQRLFSKHRSEQGISYECSEVFHNGGYEEAINLWAVGIAREYREI